MRPYTKDDIDTDLSEKICDISTKNRTSVKIGEATLLHTLCSSIAQGSIKKTHEEFEREVNEIIELMLGMLAIYRDQCLTLAARGDE